MGVDRSREHRARYAMQINNHITPSHFGNGSRPDHAANASGRGHQFQPAAADAEPAGGTDTTTAVAPAEETEGPSIPGKSVAHQARAHMAQISGLLTADGHNFGWMVSQIARGMFELSDYTTEGDGTDGAEGGTDGTDGADATTAADDTGATGEEGAPADETADAGTTPAPDAEDPVASLLDALTEEGGEGTTPAGDETIDPVVDPVVDLVDALLDNSEDDSEVT